MWPTLNQIYSVVVLTVQASYVLKELLILLSSSFTVSSFPHYGQRSCLMNFFSCTLQVPKEWTLDTDWEAEQEKAKNEGLPSHKLKCPSQWTPVGGKKERFSNVHIIDDLVISKHRSSNSTNGVIAAEGLNGNLKNGFERDDPVVAASEDLKDRTPREKDANSGSNSGLHSLAINPPVQRSHWKRIKSIVAKTDKDVGSSVNSGLIPSKQPDNGGNESSSSSG